MKLNPGLAIAVATSLLFAAPLAAADAPSLSKADTARVTFLNYAQCTLQQRGDKARDAVSLFPDSRAEMDALQALPASPCMKYSDVAFSTRLFRGALYTVMYQTRFTKGVPTITAPKPDFAAGADMALTLDQKAMVQLRDFADCVVRRDGANAHTVVIGPVGSAMEKAAFAALTPDLDACMTQGQKIPFTKPVLVGLLAEVLYREAQA